MAKKKKEIKVKEPVRIREKVLGDGTISLYLDMYHKGNRKKEGLKLYLIPESSPTAKQQNKNTRRLAEQIKAQRILDIQKDGLVDWEKLKKSRTTLDSWPPSESRICAFRRWTGSSAVDLSPSSGLANPTGERKR